MMFVHLLVLLFAAVEAIPSARFDVVYPSMETFRSGIKRIRFRALDQDIELRMEPAGDVIADDFTIISGDNGEVDHSMDIQSLKRKLYKDAEMGAALHIDEDGPLTINGIVNSKLLIEPDSSKKARRNGIIAHRVTEVIEDEHLSHDYIDKILPPGLSRTFNYSEPLPEDKCLKIEYVFVAERKFTEKFKSNSATIETYLANTMNKVEILFDSLDLGIELSIIGIIKLTKENQDKLAPYIESYPEGIAVYETLEKMSKFYCRSTDKLIQKADIVALVTIDPLGGFNDNGHFDANIGGLAYLSRICHMCKKYAVVRNFNGKYYRAIVPAHETAHLLGCDHDGEGDDITGSKDCPASDGYIMGSGKDKNWQKFSPCCKKRIENMLTGTPNHCIVETCDAKRKRK